MLPEKNIELTYKLYQTNKASFEEMFDKLLSQYKPTGIPVRLVIFDSLDSNDDYLDCLDCIREKVKEYFGEKSPTISYVAQPPYPKGLAMEMHEVLLSENDTLQYKSLNELPYIVIEGRECKRLFVSGIMGDIVQQNIRQQSDSVFETLSGILQVEQMPVSSIIRQWNYIEKITAIDPDGHQHYQDFNDARSLFYQLGRWENGYPAATGIGTEWGGVMVDVDALSSRHQVISIKAVDNPLQVSAHAYSQCVLLGEKDEKLLQKTTPKFERAKAVWKGNNGFVYISGTAAIRGEKSLQGVGISEQALITLDNINYLISDENLHTSGIPATRNGLPVCFRVYVKRWEDMEEASQVIRKQYPDIPAVYTLTDVCRSELLIEIEGLAFIE